MSAPLAAALTTCQTALGVSLSPQISPNRFTRRKVAPPLMSAAVVHSLDGSFRPQRNWDGADVLSFANQVSDYPALFANLEILRSESN
jgi:hypothetical protein